MTSTDLSSPDVESVVRRYYDVVSDLGSTEDDLRPLLSDSVEVIEHPNAITPHGATRGLEETVAGFRAGKALLRDQAFEIAEVLAAGERAAVRATWRGTIARDAGPFRSGLEIRAQVAALLTVREGQVVKHETFDCYEPFDV